VCRPKRANVLTTLPRAPNDVRIDCKAAKHSDGDRGAVLAYLEADLREPRRQPSVDCSSAAIAARANKRRFVNLLQQLGRAYRKPVSRESSVNDTVIPRMEKVLTKRDFRQLVRNFKMHSIENDSRMHNLARGYWVYDELLADLSSSGWQRFGPGFKGGVYGHESIGFCIKILGMGVGANPLYFAERGYYLEHERNMMQRFRDAGFTFAPEVLNCDDTVRFLKMCGVRPHQAELRIARNDVMVTERIPGVPLAIQTGRGLTYDLCVDAFDAEVISEMEAAIERLRLSLHRANVHGLLHNDPMPPNIIFTTDDGGKMCARLVDFEIAQSFASSTPEFVTNTVAELYRERGVPVNQHNSEFTTNLDMHLLDQSAAVLEHVRRAAERRVSLLDTFTIEVPLIGVSIEVGNAWRYIQDLL